MESQLHILPPDLIELQIGQIDLLLAMYPDETIIEEHTKNILDTLRDSDAEKSQEVVKATPAISVQLDLPISPEEREDIETSGTATDKRLLRLDLSIPLTYTGASAPSDPPNPKVRVQQPSWLSKAATLQLSNSIVEGQQQEEEEGDQDLLTTIESLREKASVSLSETLKKSSSSSNTTNNGSGEQQRLVRVFFYFPSISTRSKRDDFITHAPSYALTGFLYAGKPGLLCVEGTSGNIDEYMRFIKTESWGDIPAHHKKVSERYREEVVGGEAKRVFVDMSEITDLVGERRGARANRGDMKAVEEWLVERGLGEAFSKVLM